MQTGWRKPTLLELLKEDFATHDKNPFEPGFWAVAVHRIGARVPKGGSRLKRAPLRLAYRALATAVDWTWSIRVAETTELGRRVRIWHNGAILLQARTIGDDVHIRQATTFGPLRGADASNPEELPVIEDGADIGSGAAVLGGITVGRGAVIGANSVVLKPVPAGAHVLGVPARIIPR